MTRDPAVGQALSTHQTLTWRGGQEAPAYQAFTCHDIEKLPQFKELSSDQQLALKTVAEVLPFRTNRYVADHLVDWSNIPDDALFQLNFSQGGCWPPTTLRPGRGWSGRKLPARRYRLLVPGSGTVSIPMPLDR